MHMTDEEILAAVRADLERVFPGPGAKIVESRLERFPYAFPVMTPGAYKRLMRLHALNTGRLLLAGDYMVYPTFEGAASSATYGKCMGGYSRRCLQGKIEVSFQLLPPSAPRGLEVAVGH